MWKELLLSSTLLLHMILGVGPVLGQGGTGDTQQPAATQISIGQETMKIQLKGDELPQYSVVSMCLLRMNRYLDETNSSHEIFLSKIGVEHDSPAEDFLVGVARKAAEIIVAPGFDRTLKGEAFRRHQFEEMKKKARNLGIVYQSLLDGLGEAGLDSKRIVQYCENEVKPNVSHSSSGDTFEMYMTAVKEFDKQLADSDIKKDNGGRQ